MENVVLIIGAMEEELCYLINKLINKKEIIYQGFKFYEGEMFENKIVICECGIGTINSATALTISIEKYKPRIIINNGLSGGYTKEIRKGKIVVGLDVVDITVLDYKGTGNNMEDYEITTFLHGEQNRIVMPKACDEVIKLIKQNFENEELYFGRLASGNIWNKNKDRIQYLYNKYGAICEDMESISIYKVANIYKIPAVCIRGISNNEVLDEPYDYSVSEKMQKITEKLVSLVCR